MSDRPTLDTVAAAAGVSRMTVSNAYNRPDQISAATREKVLAAAARLGYAGPNPTAASLRRQRTGTVGVVLTEQLPYAFTDPGMVQILHGIATGLSQAGMSLLLVPDSGGAGDPALLRQAMVDAFILCSLPADDPGLTAVRERHVPLVTVGSPKLPKVPTIGIDNRAVAGLMGPHLLGLGHRRFAVLTVTTGDRPARPGWLQRPEGFAASLDGASVLRIEAAANNRASGAAAVADLLAMPAGQRPTALFAVTDILALGALEAARSAGVDVPGELSIAGLDDIPEAAASGLTSIDQQLLAQGEAAANLAVRLIAGESVRAPRTEVRLVPRATTGPAPR